LRHDLSTRSSAGDWAADERVTGAGAC
jgi:hypothetical protein